MASNHSFAQSFTMQHDTVSFGTGGLYNAMNELTNPSATAPITIQWRIVGTDFPADWKTNSGICDAVNCYTSATVYSGANFSCIYNPGIGDFHLQMDHGSTTSTGTHYVKVLLNNAAIPTDTALVTFIVSKIPASVTSANSVRDIAVYPNPAINELNVVYDASADIKSIAVYNIIGRALTVYKVTNNSSANLKLDNIPSGVYFIRLMNSAGEIVGTKKFTKQ